MKNICLVALVIMGLMITSVVSFAGTGSSCSMEKPVSATAPASDSKAINLKNKVCPVLGEKIDEANKVPYEYNGKVYDFCCTSCVDEFKKDPAKYIDKVNQELGTDKVTK